MSETMAIEDFQQRVLAELASVRADNEHLRAEVRELWSQHRSTPPDALVQAEGAGGEGVGIRSGISRSQFLRLGAGAAAAAGAGGLLSARSAAAATGNPVLVGGITAPTLPTDATRIVNPSTTELSDRLLYVDNRSDSTTPPPATARVAVLGNTSGLEPGSKARVGVWGQSNGPSRCWGVVGTGGFAGNPPSIEGTDPVGVLGIAAGGGVGVMGQADESTATANAIGVFGKSERGVGVLAESEDFISLLVAGNGRMHQVRRAVPSVAGDGEFYVGDQIRDFAGELWLCMASGFPGTWRRAALVRDGFVGGSMNFLTRPIRLLDTRLSGPALAPGATRNVQVTGVAVDGISVPSGAVGVIGNVTVVSTGASGYLTLFPQGSPPTSGTATASINWFDVNQVLNTAAVVRLGPLGQIGIGNGLAGGSSTTDVVFDASGFVF